MRKKNTEYTGKKLIDKKIHQMIFFVLICLLILTGCGESKEKTLDIVAEYQIPFAAVGQRWNKVEFFEQDSMGRELYLYHSEGEHTNVFSDYMDQSYRNAPVIAYIVVQKEDRDFVYCYENVCYEYAPSLATENGDIITNLKAANDWEKPLCNSKMMALPKDMETNGVSDYKIVFHEKELMEAFETAIGEKIENYYLDCIFSVDGTPIFLLRKVNAWLTQTSKNVFGESYVFVRTKTDEIKYLQLSDQISDWNEIIDCFLKNIYLNSSIPVSC